MGNIDLRKEFENVYKLLLEGKGGTNVLDVMELIESEDTTVEELRDLCLDLLAENILYKKRIRDLLKGE